MEFDFISRKERAKKGSEVYFFARRRSDGAAIKFWFGSKYELKWSLRWKISDEIFERDFHIVDWADMHTYYPKAAVEYGFIDFSKKIPAIKRRITKTLPAL